jgi:hypothetical protein
LSLILAATLISIVPKGQAAADWPPISQEELAMKDNPAEPGALAMILFREERVETQHSFENYYFRIKIFKDEGKKYANIEIPFIKGDAQVQDLRARTIHPDGKIIESDAKVMEKLAIKDGDISILEKTFTLPDVIPGSIIEYRYKIQRDPDAYYNTYWRLQEELYTRRAHFVFIPPDSGGLPLILRAVRATGISPQKQKDGSYVLDIQDMAGLEEEEFMLPEEELRGRVEFIFRDDEPTPNPKDYWDKVGKERADAQDKFIGKRSSMRDIVSQVTKPEDAPEVKLRKLYARAQQIHNVDDEPKKTDQEAKRQKAKDNNNVDDVLKHGSGTSEDVNRFFEALVQAAGFESSDVWVAQRTDGLFHPQFEERKELNDLIVYVHAADKTYFLDPAVGLCPFGILPWYETNVTGLRPTKQGAVFVDIPPVPSADSVTARNLQLKLDPDGTLSGTLTIRFTGETALHYRHAGRDEDDAGKKKLITDKVKEWMPSNAKFELTSVTGWDTPDTPLEAQGKLQLPGMAESVGRRLLLPIGFYEAGQRQLFDASARKQDIYFHYPYQDVDEIVVQLPAGFQAGALPTPQVVDPGGQLRYEISAKQDGTSLHVERKLIVGGLNFQSANYGALRKFFSTAKSNDEQQLVLQATASGNN